MKSQEPVTLGSALVFGIIFGEDQLIGYYFIGVGVMLSVISKIGSRRKWKRPSTEVR